MPDKFRTDIKFQPSYKMNFPKIKTALLLTMFSTFAAPAFALQPPQFSNGDFELGSLGNWSMGGNAYFETVAGVAGGVVLPTNSDYSILFNGGDTAPNGWIQQTFATNAGATYNVSFDYGATYGGTQSIEVFTTGASNNLLGYNTFTAINTDSMWVTETPMTHNQFSFVADGNFASIKFADAAGNNTNSQDAFLDSVAITAAVPEPETYAMLLAGLGLMGAAVKRRKANQA